MRALCRGRIAQSVEQRIENPRVGSSILPLTTILSVKSLKVKKNYSFCRKIH